MESARYWRNQKQRYGLIGEVCPSGHLIFPPRDLCPDCTKEAKAPYQFSGRGEIYSYTTVYDAPEGYEGMVPYTVAMIQLAEGPFVTAQLTDIHTGAVTIGDKVEMVTRKLFEDGKKGTIVYGYKFRPALPTC